MTSPESAKRTRRSWTAAAAFAIAVLAAALAVWALVRTPPSQPAVASEPTVEPEHSGGDKASVCAAFAMVRNAVSMQTNADLGPDPIARAAVAANARLATLGGGGYLLSQVNSTSPADLADAARGFGENLQDIGMKQLVGTPTSDPGLAAQLTDAQNQSNRITDLCK